MPNIAAVLRDEIRRLARKEVKTSTGAVKQAVVQHRREIAKLKQEIKSQQKKITALMARSEKRAESPVAEDEATMGNRFSARSVRAQRKRLELSAEQYGRLVGVSGLTIYNWEHGKSRPRKAQLVSLFAVRGIGKREAKKRLEGAK
jgi:DNA-binding transcriptional regulator YiaG